MNFLNKKNKIIWIASYPKSGNTWLRSIISAMFLNNEGKFNFNLLNKINSYDIPLRYDFVKDISKNDYEKLDDLNILSKYWIESQRRIFDKENKSFFSNVSFFKTHSANINFNGKEFTSSENSAGLIYIIRDPRDLVISYSKHYQNTIDETIEMISNNIHLLRSTEKKYPILISTPDLHYKSWKNLKAPKIVIKYEDLLINPEKTINDIMMYFQLFFNHSFNNQEMILKNLVETTRFKKMQNYEKNFGFNEATYSTQNKKNNNYFFRKGLANQWKKVLSHYQIKKIETACANIMQRFNYL